VAERLRSARFQHPANARSPNTERFGDGRGTEALRFHLAHLGRVSLGDSPLDRLSSVVCDAVALDLDRHASTYGPGFGHDRCESGERRASEHLSCEAVRYDKQFLADAARGVGQCFQGTALFATETHRRCGGVCPG
jgi:hypothetical protein